MTAVADRYRLGLSVGDVVVSAHWGHTAPQGLLDVRSRYVVVGFTNGRVRVQSVDSAQVLAVRPEFMQRVIAAVAA